MMMAAASPAAAQNWFEELVFGRRGASPCRDAPAPAPSSAPPAPPRPRRRTAPPRAKPTPAGARAAAAARHPAQPVVTAATAPAAAPDARSRSANRRAGERLFQRPVHAHRRFHADRRRRARSPASFTSSARQASLRIRCARDPGGHRRRPLGGGARPQARDPGSLYDLADAAEIPAARPASISARTSRSPASPRKPMAVRILLEDRSTLGGTSQIALFFDPDVQTLKQWRIVDPQGFRPSSCCRTSRAAAHGSEAVFHQLPAHGRQPALGAAPAGSPVPGCLSPPCALPSRPGTSTPSGCASSRSAASSRQRGPTCCACRRPSAPTTSLPLKDFQRLRLSARRPHRPEGF